MKVVIITTIILILFFTGALFFSQYVTINNEKLLTTIDKLDKAILVEDWETAKGHLDNIKEDWNKVNTIYEVLLEHYDIDSVNVSLNKIEKYMEVEERNLIIGEVTQLRFIIDLIKKRETFTLSNLL